MTREVADAVANALSSAHENGYDFEAWSDEAIADDMMEFDADVGGMPRGEVVHAIKELRKVGLEAARARWSRPDL
jgi:hypothetical protein